MKNTRTLLFTFFLMKKTPVAAKKAAPAKKPMAKKPAAKAMKKK